MSGVGVEISEVLKRVAIAVLQQERDCLLDWDQEVWLAVQRGFLVEFGWE